MGPHERGWERRWSRCIPGTPRVIGCEPASWDDVAEQVDVEGAAGPAASQSQAGGQPVQRQGTLGGGAHDVMPPVSTQAGVRTGSADRSAWPIGAHAAARASGAAATAASGAGASGWEAVALLPPCRLTVLVDAADREQGRPRS